MTEDNKTDAEEMHHVDMSALIDLLPENPPGPVIGAMTASIIMTYSSNTEDVMALLKLTTDALMALVDDAVSECDCPDCMESRRKAGMN